MIFKSKILNHANISDKNFLNWNIFKEIASQKNYAFLRAEKVLRHVKKQIYNTNSLNIYKFSVAKINLW
jgi:hypothetical protein